MGVSGGMNYLVIPTFFVAFVFFTLGTWFGQRTGVRAFVWWCLLGVVAAVPGVLFAVYYLKVLGEPIWLYQFRSLPWSELSAGPAGLLAGLLHGRFSKRGGFRKLAGAWFFPGVLFLGLAAPYLKPLIWRMDRKQFQDRWLDDVCLQTTESSCGPACAATLLRKFGHKETESEIAEEAHTSRGGTENWYLARALHHHGVDPHFMLVEGTNQAWPAPAIAGVRLPDAGNVGHFIAVLGREGEKYVVGDPANGKVVGTPGELRKRYEFTGFFMVVERGTGTGD